MSAQPPNLDEGAPLGSTPAGIPDTPIVTDNLSPGSPQRSPTQPETLMPGGKPCQYPPYPPYSMDPQPISLMEMITGGKTIRYQYKSFPPQPARPLPKPAGPKGPKVTDVRMTRREYRAHARCLRRHGAVLTERLERISRPTRRKIIYMWRDKAEVLTAETIARFRSMLDADEPFKPDQAYQYFVNLKKSKKRNKCPPQGLKAKAKRKMDVYGDKKCEWARNATIHFARSIQQRLGQPGSFSLQDGMLNMSNVVMSEIAKFLHMKPVHRSCAHPKAKFLMELSDKIAVWIDEMMLESDERMLMMDVDEDDEVTEYKAALLKAEMTPAVEDTAQPGSSKNVLSKASVEAEGADNVTAVEAMEQNPRPPPTSPQPTSPQPTSPQPTSPQPISPQPTSPQPTSPQPTTPQPTTPHPTSPQPQSPPPGPDNTK